MVSLPLVETGRWSRPVRIRHLPLKRQAMNEGSNTMEIHKQSVAVIGIEMQMTYEDRMDLVRMLTFGDPDAKVSFRVQTYDHGGEPTAHLSVGGSFGRAVEVSDFAVKVKEEVSA